MRSNCCCCFGKGKALEENTRNSGAIATPIKVVNLGVTYSIQRLKSSTDLTVFSYKEMKDATNNFKEKLGGGGFGAVYKGELPPLEQQGRPIPIAVKRLSIDSKKGFREFEAEVKIFSRVRHRNLVELLGWCCEAINGDSTTHHIMLVYEFVANGSLQYHLHESQNRENCQWPRRFNILSEVGDALVYLHQDASQGRSILHRDIKPHNIMLDENYKPKLGDFGLSRQLEKGKSYYETMTVDAPLFGTRGYIAPELLFDTKFTKEMDVYSFGVVMLEVATGKRPIECVEKSSAASRRRYENSKQPLIESVWDLHGQGRLLEAADRRLHHLFDEEEMRRVLIVGLACCHPDPQARLNAKEAVQVLSGAVRQLPCIPRAMPPHVDPAALLPDAYVAASSTSKISTASGSNYSFHTADNQA